PDRGKELCMTAVILAGDVGGTKTHLGLFRIDNGAPTLLREHRYVTHDFASLEDVCAHFLGTPKESVQAACFGVPGPIIAGEANATNVHWKMREDSLRH